MREQIYNSMRILKKIQKQYPKATPNYEIEFKKPLTPIRKYYSELLKKLHYKKA